MGVARAEGYNDIGAWAPELFSTKVQRKFNGQTFLRSICNVDYEAELKAKGTKVTIRNKVNVPIYKVSKGMGVSWASLVPTTVELDMDQANGFNILLSKIDEKQMDIKNFLNMEAEQAAIDVALTEETDFLAAIYADAHASNQGTTAGVKSGLYNLGATGSPLVIDETNVTKVLTRMLGVLAEQNIPLDDNWWAVIPPWMWTVILNSNISVASVTGDAVSPIRNGKFGKVAGFNFHVTNQYTSVTDGANQCWNMIFGHKSAIVYASQFRNIEYFAQLETRQEGMGVKGTHVCGWKASIPAGLGVVYGYGNTA